jgi:hypothetical protein
MEMFVSVKRASLLLQNIGPNLIVIIREPWTFILITMGEIASQITT